MGCCEGVFFGCWCFGYFVGFYEEVEYGSYNEGCGKCFNDFKDLLFFWCCFNEVICCEILYCVVCYGSCGIDNCCDEDCGYYVFSFGEVKGF